MATVPERKLCGFVYDDGGRAAAGFKGEANDCCVRAAAIITRIPYREVYDEINRLAQKHERPRKGRKRSNSRTGVFTRTARRFLEAQGLVWTPTMQIGSGCRVHLRADELPGGRLVVNVSRHFVAVIDGVIHDNHDCSRDGTRCVYGYWHVPDGTDD